MGVGCEHVSTRFEFDFADGLFKDDGVEVYLFAVMLHVGQGISRMCVFVSLDVCRQRAYTTGYKEYFRDVVKVHV